MAIRSHKSVFRGLQQLPRFLTAMKQADSAETSTQSASFSCVDQHQGSTAFTTLFIPTPAITSSSKAGNLNAEDSHAGLRQNKDHRQLLKVSVSQLIRNLAKVYALLGYEEKSVAVLQIGLLESMEIDNHNSSSLSGRSPGSRSGDMLSERNDFHRSGSNKRGTKKTKNKKPLRGASDVVRLYLQQLVPLYLQMDEETESESGMTIRRAEKQGEKNADEKHEHEVVSLTREDRESEACSRTPSCPMSIKKYNAFAGELLKYFGFEARFRLFPYDRICAEEAAEETNHAKNSSSPPSGDRRAAPAAAGPFSLPTPAVAVGPPSSPSAVLVSSPPSSTSTHDKSTTPLSSSSAASASAPLFILDNILSERSLDQLKQIFCDQFFHAHGYDPLLYDCGLTEGKNPSYFSLFHDLQSDGAGAPEEKGYLDQILHEFLENVKKHFKAEWDNEKNKATSTSFPDQNDESRARDNCKRKQEAEFVLERLTKVRFAETWTHKRTHLGYHQLHVDAKDEGMLDKDGKPESPVATFVLYLSGGGGSAGRASRRQKQDEEPQEQLPPRRESSCPLAPTVISTQKLGSEGETIHSATAQMVFPVENRAVCFSGDLYHGVVPGMIVAGGRRGRRREKISNRACEEVDRSSKQATSEGNDEAGAELDAESLRARGKSFSCRDSSAQDVDKVVKSGPGEDENVASCEANIPYRHTLMISLWENLTPNRRSHEKSLLCEFTGRRCDLLQLDKSPGLERAPVMFRRQLPRAADFLRQFAVDPEELNSRLQSCDSTPESRSFVRPERPQLLTRDLRSHSWLAKAILKPVEVDEDELDHHDKSTRTWNDLAKTSHASGTHSSSATRAQPICAGTMWEGVEGEKLKPGFYAYENVFQF
ncbi:unnamed protein product [Amoebophrya sp. A120]|nr:unnamed protein product [Amoebophrya sp. A120]|eukprot:GSA120T00003891001.1